MSIESENLLKKFQILSHSEKGILEEIMRAMDKHGPWKGIETLHLATPWLSGPLADWVYAVWGLQVGREWQLIDGPEAWWSNDHPLASGLQASQLEEYTITMNSLLTANPTHNCSPFPSHEIQPGLCQPK